VTETATTEPILTTRQIEKLIPHRWPFLLVDRIVEYDQAARRIVGLKSVSAGEWFFAGHFPGQPIMPGVLQVEALAQTMGVFVAQEPGFGDRLGVADISLDETVARVVCNVRQVLQTSRVGKRVKVDDVPIGALGKHRTHEVRPDETAAARNQDSHHSTFL
jgi:3-hydroxymyristoyl/3-hydroxydecanoyl-(acyl carrier protein) dehydratase